MATDYYQLLARAVAGLASNTGDARRALYERARAALLAQLRAVVPPLSEGEITRERLALEEAIRKVEVEQQRAVAERSMPPPEILSDSPRASSGPATRLVRRPASVAIPSPPAGSLRDDLASSAALSLGEIDALRQRADARPTPLPDSITRWLDPQRLDDDEELKAESRPLGDVLSVQYSAPEIDEWDQVAQAHIPPKRHRPFPEFGEGEPRYRPARPAPPPARRKSGLLLLAASAALLASATGYVFRDQLTTAIEKLIGTFRPARSSLDVPRGPWSFASTVLPLFGMVVPPAGGNPSSSGGVPMDVVDVSAFAPNEGRAGESVMVQVYLHKVRQLASVRGQAKKKDPGTSHRETATLATEIPRGENVDVELTCEGLFEGAQVRRLRWADLPTVTSFSVKLPRASAGHSHTMEIRILVGDIPIGYLAFVMPVRDVSQPIDATARIQGTKAKRYRYAFMSYSSTDRVEVLKNARLLQALNIEFFQDILSLRSGQEFEPKLFSEIDKCDLFLLFWSQKAAESHWVIRETEYALTRQGANTEKEPEIKPIILESNPIPRPPKSLDHLHFNDFITHVIAAIEAASAHRGA